MLVIAGTTPAATPATAGRNVGMRMYAAASTARR